MAEINEGRLYLACKNYADRALKFDLNAMIAISGPMGSGKSSLAIRMAEILRDEWGMEFRGADDVYFSLRDFETELRTAKYRVMIVDEAGVQLYSRDFAKEINKEIAKVAQMLRFRNSVIIWTLPHIKFLDKTVRLLMHHVWRTRVLITRNGAIRQARPYVIETDYIHDYMKIVPAVYTTQTGQKKEFPWIQWKMPEKEVWEAYNKKKEAFWLKKMEPMRKFNHVNQFFKWLEKSRPDLLELAQRRGKPKRIALAEMAEISGYSEEYLRSRLPKYLKRHRYAAVKI